MGLTLLVLGAFLMHEEPEDRAHHLRGTLDVPGASLKEQLVLAEAEYRAGNWGEAARHIGALLNDTQPPAEAYWFDAHLKERLGELQQAEVSMRRYLSIEGSRRTALSDLARIVAAQGRVEEAGNLYAQAVSKSLNPDDVLRSARLSKDAGDYLLAIRRIEAGIDTLGPAIPLLEEKMSLRIEMGQNRQALSDLEDLLKLAPKHPRWNQMRDELKLLIVD